MKVLRSFLLLTLCVAPLLSANYPTQVKRSVTFLFTKDSLNRLTPKGTGFFVLVKEQQGGDTASFGYLVTTKQTLQQDGRYVDSVFVRINRKGGSSDTLIVQLRQNGNPRFFVHPDTTVDLVMVPAFPDANRYEILYLPAGMIGGVDIAAKENISEGTELFLPGMAADQFGLFRNIPAVWFGRIIQFSEEKYRWGNSYAEFAVMETGASAGIDGAPVFYYSDAVRDTGAVMRPPKLLLFGIAAGPYPQGSKEHRMIRVVPAAKLLEMLALPSVGAEREKEFNRLKDSKQ